MVQTLLLHSSPIVHRIPSKMVFSSPKTTLFSKKQIKKMPKNYHNIHSLYKFDANQLLMSQNVAIFPILIKLSFPIQKAELVPWDELNVELKCAEI